MEEFKTRQLTEEEKIVLDYEKQPNGEEILQPVKRPP
jgi:hypothetical protein